MIWVDVMKYYINLWVFCKKINLDQEARKKIKLFFQFFLSHTPQYNLFSSKKYNVIKLLFYFIIRGISSKSVS